MYEFIAVVSKIRQNQTDSILIQTKTSKNQLSEQKYLIYPNCAALVIFVVETEFIFYRIAGRLDRCLRFLYTLYQANAKQ